MPKPPYRLDLIRRSARKPLSLLTAIAAAAALAIAFAAGCSTPKIDPAPADQRAETLSAPETVRLTASRDTSVRSDFPNDNFGRDRELQINRALVAFDLAQVKSSLGPSDNVVSASLELRLSDNDLSRRSARVASVFRLTRALSERGASWSCALASR